MEEPWLRHCHEIAVHGRRLFLSSTGFDALLGFDLDARSFDWGMRVAFDGIGYRALPFDPNGGRTAEPSNELHLNQVFCDTTGMYLGGLHVCGMLRFDGRRIDKVVALPAGIHNVRPWRDGVLFNDTASDRLCCVTSEGTRMFRVPRPDAPHIDDTAPAPDAIARAGFARGLCEVDARTVAAGSSPSTITLYDLDAARSVGSVVLSRDVRNAIHGLERWPYPVE